MSDDAELTFDEVAEFLGKAGAEAGQQLLLTLLQDALDQLHALRAEVAALAAKPAQYTPPPVYGGGGYFTKGAGTSPATPYGHWNDPNTVYVSQNTAAQVRFNLDKFYDNYDEPEPGHYGGQSDGLGGTFCTPACNHTD